jgi:hypothetical protein
MIRRLSVGILAGLALAARVLGGSADQGPLSDPAVLQRAEAAFDRGAAAYEKDPDAARRSFTESAAAYGTLAYERGIRNARLLANLGNASLLSGDVGRAMLAYRRAERIDPADRTVRAGLALVRSRVETISRADGEDAFAWLERWRAVLPPRALLLTGVGAWVLGWAALAINRMIPVGGRPRWAGIAAVLLGATCIAVVAADQAVRLRSPEAVVIARSIEGRKGPGGAVYEPSFDKPLSAGVELRIVEERTGWARVRLLDGRETWVPLGAIERV